MDSRLIGVVIVLGFMLWSFGRRARYLAKCSKCETLFKPSLVAQLTTTSAVGQCHYKCPHCGFEGFMKIFIKRKVRK